MNYPILAWPDFNALWRFISQKIYEIGAFNFSTIFMNVFNLCYQNLKSISLTVSKLWAFWQRSNFGNFQQFFHHNCRLKWKFWILNVASESSISDLSEYSLLYIKKIDFWIDKNQFLGEIFLHFFMQFFFQITSKVYWFYKF